MNFISKKQSVGEEEAQDKGGVCALGSTGAVAPLAVATVLLQAFVVKFMPTSASVLMDMGPGRGMLGPRVVLGSVVIKT
jgi:hypothetical protein